MTNFIQFIESFNAMANDAHANARNKGFWNKRDEVLNLCEAHGLGQFGRKLIASQLRELIVSEMGEACEGDRKSAMDDKVPQFMAVEAELADVIIRIGDYACAFGLRVGEAVIAKMEMNKGREAMHGGKAF